MVGRAWRYVTLDATGTLMRPAEATGETYLRFWETVSGQSFSASRQAALVSDLTAHFPAEYNLQSQRRPNFGADGVATSAFPWWRDLLLAIMKAADVPMHADKSERFTRELYAHFGRPEAWTVFEDVRPVLDRLQTAGVRMGVISNFDERLEPLLDALGLRAYFDVVTTSFDQPHMKPHASIFQSTFAQLQGDEGDVDASQFLHVGDHSTRDYKAAKAVGAHAQFAWRNTQKSLGASVAHVLLVVELVALCLVQTNLRIREHPTRENARRRSATRRIQRADVSTFGILSDAVRTRRAMRR